MAKVRREVRETVDLDGIATIITSLWAKEKPPFMSTQVSVIKNSIWVIHNIELGPLKIHLINQGIFTEIATKEIADAFYIIFNRLKIKNPNIQGLRVAENQGLLVISYSLVFWIPNPTGQESSQESSVTTNDLPLKCASWGPHLFGG
ncbi:MAG TPA: hypothetical protein VJH71_02275 [Candidatus Paceibacterota bacterium]